MMDLPIAAGDETLVQLDADAKEFVLRQAAEICSAVSFLHKQIKDDQASTNLVRSVIGIAEHSIADISPKLGYDSLLAIELEQRNKHIRDANIRIRELEEMLGANRPLDGLAEQVRVLNKTAEKFWRNQGFGGYIHDFNVTSHGGIHMKLGFSICELGHLINDHPVTERKSLQQRIDSLKERGFDLLKMDTDNNYAMADNDNNRLKLLLVIKTQYPSAKVISFNNSLAEHNKDDYYIREIDIRVHDVRDFADTAADNGQPDKQRRNP